MRSHAPAIISQTYGSIHTTLYTVLVCTLGLVMLVCLSYSVLDHRDTISNTMNDNRAYRIAVSTCIVLQMFFWITCVYSKRQTDESAAAYGMFSLGLSAFGWIGLTTVIEEGYIHTAFAGVFVTAFVILLLVMCKLTLQRLALDALILSVTILLVCTALTTIHYLMFGMKEFYVMEHMGFIAYNVIFTGFFLVHQPDEWMAEP